MPLRTDTARRPVEQRLFTPELFQEHVIDLLGSPEELAEMSGRARGLGRLSGGPRIVEQIRADVEAGRK